MSAPLDLRHLPPPEPMQRILDALDALPAGARLDALTPHRPEPLLPTLAQWGFTWRIEPLPGGGAHIAICHRRDHALLEAATPEEDRDGGHAAAVALAAGHGTG